MKADSHVVKVWDLPTRIFHWSTVFTLLGLWWTADSGEMEYHQILAYLLMVLVVFRIFWGFIGSETSRFHSFIYSPKTVVNYAVVTSKQGISHSVGHNPIGGYMVLALLLVLLLQLVSGLFATDDVLAEGPFYSYVSQQTAEQLTWLHKNLFNLILFLVAMHVAAVVLHSIKGDAIVPAMVTGKKRLTKVVSTPKIVPVWRAIIVCSVLTGVVGSYFVWPVWQGL